MVIRDAGNGTPAKISTTCGVVETRPFLIPFSNHPSGLTFSPEDITAFVSNAEMQMIIAVGNNGTLFLMEKTTSVNISRAVALLNRLLREFPHERLVLMKNFIKEVDKFGFYYYETGN